MDVPTLLRAMAQRIATVSGVRRAHYPPPNALTDTPTVVLYWGSDEDTAIQHNLGGQLWLPAVKAQVLGARLGDTPREFARVDALLTPIVDAFDTADEPGGVSAILPELAGHVDRVHVARIRPTLQIGYAGHEYYGAELYFSIKFRRQRGA